MSRDEVLAILDKKWKNGDELLAEMGDPAKYEGVPVISTGVASMDYISGGGLPRGMITEWWGPEGGGKTTTALLACTEAHKEGNGEVAYVDMEHKLRDWKFMHRLGIDRDKFHMIRPESGDQGADIITELAKSNFFELIVLDSVAGLYPERIQDASAADQQYAGIARMASTWLGAQLTPVLGATKTALLMLNQERTNITNYGAFPYAAGGKAIRHHCVVINRLRQVGKPIKDDRNRPAGIEIEATNRKNQMGMPYLETTYQFFFRAFGSQNFGVNKEYDTLMVARELGIVEVRGSWFYYVHDEDETRLGQGEDTAVTLMKKQPQIYEVIRDDVRNVDRLSPENDVW